MANSPEKIGKYYALEVVGSGNMAIVYRGYDPFSDREVAIKVSHEKLEAMNFPGTLTRKLFFNEAQAAGALVHPNIVRVLDAGEQDGAPYLVMDYIGEGKTLDAYCRGEQRLADRQIGEIIYHCARALDYSHRHGVIHRDVKPSNILVTSQGRVKLTDFGIAQRSNTMDETQIMGLLGSPTYMSPEQVRQEDLNPQTDVYSLGVVMYELLTGGPPFRASNVAGLMYRIMNEAPLRPSLDPDTPVAVHTILDQAMAKDRDDRYQSAAEMAEALFEAFDGIRDNRDRISEERKLEYVKRLEFFSNFSDGQIREILTDGTWISHAPGETILLEGSMDLAFYIIVAGHVAVRKNDEVLCRLAAGNCFGEMGYLAKVERTASIIAGEPVLLLALNANVIKRTSLDCQLKFNEAFIRTLIGRLAMTSEALVQATKHPQIDTDVA